MAYRNESEKTPDCLIELFDYIERNTGLCGEENVGDAHLSAGGTTLMITHDRRGFDKDDHLLSRIEDDETLRIQTMRFNTSYRFNGPHPYLEVVQK